MATKKQANKKCELGEKWDGDWNKLSDIQAKGIEVIAGMKFAEMGKDMPAITVPFIHQNHKPIKWNK